MKRIVIKSLKGMDAFAAKFAKHLKGGEALALVGDLGSGKTAFVKALAKAFGIKSVVQSPTFLLMKCYPIKRSATRETPRAICHVDAYRVKKETELVHIGLLEHLDDPATITAIEWAELVKGIIPERAIWMNFFHGKKTNERIIEY